MNLYLYDFDGTISRRDSMVAFVLFVKKNKIGISLLLSLPLVIKFFLGKFSKDQLKEQLLVLFFREFSEDELRLAAANFSAHFVESYVYRSALESIQLAKQKEGQLCIVTASLDIWMKDIANELELDLICTEAAFSESKFVGFQGKNCIGKEKADRVTSVYDITEYQDVICFGNSKGDAELLGLGTKTFYQYFT